jgi:Ca2+-binding RTX toxin-like protein
MAATLTSLTTALTRDTGLTAGVSAADLQAGLAAAEALNAQILALFAELGLNADGRITGADLQLLSDRVQADGTTYNTFLLHHGDDEWSGETGFHLLQNDGGNLMFQGRKFVDTVADAIYHYGFDIIAGRFVNEDGNANELADDVAGWLNYFLNGQNMVYGSDLSEVLHSGDYSEVFAKARNEQFLAGAGDDEIWSGEGHDTVYGGTGNDVSGGGTGYDRMYGEAGDDTLYGDEGRDSLYGGAGNDDLGGGYGDDLLDGGFGADRIWAGDGNDTVMGGAGSDEIGAGLGANLVSGGDGNDTIYGDMGADTLSGDAGNDEIGGGDSSDRIDGGEGNDRIWGGNGADVLAGGAGDDTISGGEGRDYLRGGTGRDLITLWETVQSADTLVFAPGESGRTLATIDRIEGFESGVDKINLRAFGPMTFEEIDFAGGGQASVFYDGRFLRIDGNGDGACDMMVEFAWVGSLVASDMILA